MNFWGFIQENYVIILVTLAELVGGIFSVISLVKRNKKTLNKYSTLTSVIADLPSMIELAEKIEGLDGESKKTYVMNQVTLKLNSLGITASAEEIVSLSDMVDSLVTLSKTINTYTNKTTPSSSVKEAQNSISAISKIGGEK